jgi:voltage-gated potassium channel
VAAALLPRPVERRVRRTFAETWFFLRGLRVLVRPTFGLLATQLLGAAILKGWGDPSLTWPEAVFFSYTLLLGQVQPPLPVDPAAAAVLYLLPLLGILFLAEGVIKLGFTVFRKNENNEAWMSILARSSRQHIILCGLGTVGFRILEELVRLGEQVFVIERRADAEFLDRARALGAEIILGDARTENLVRSLNVEHARAVILATNDDLTNLEIAMDIREMKIETPIVLRLFDQRLAQKVRGTLGIQVSLSTSQLAAPLFASAALTPGVVGTHRVGDRLLVVVEVAVDPRGRLANRAVGEVCRAHQLTCVGVQREGERWVVQPDPDVVLEPYQRAQFLVEGARAGVVREVNGG